MKIKNIIMITASFLVSTSALAHTNVCGFTDHFNIRKSIEPGLHYIIKNGSTDGGVTFKKVNAWRFDVSDNGPCSGTANVTIVSSKNSSHTITLQIVDAGIYQADVTTIQNNHIHLEGVDDPFPFNYNYTIELQDRKKS